MTTATTPVAAGPPSVPESWTLADLWEQLGNIPLSRIRMRPPPGTATEQDVLRSEGHAGRVCELIDGVLVEKAMGFKESLVGGAILAPLRDFVRSHGLGVVLGADGTLRITPSQVRVPDVCFISWEKFPGGVLHEAPIPHLAPDLAVEVLSADNTPGEMQRKLREYFAAGTRLVWYVDPRTRTATAFTGVDQQVIVHEDGLLSGGGVLPGFELRLRDVFADLEGKPAKG